MTSDRKLFFFLMALMLASCAAPTPVIQTVEVTREVPVTAQVEVTRVVEVTPAMKVPFEELWAKSAHADKTAEAFKHWDNATPVEIPADCARCHSTPGYQEYIATGKVAGPVATGTVIECQACHNEAASNLTSVTFPSGATIETLGPEARCMTCHQGRASKKDVDDGIAKAGLTDPDTIGNDLGFTNIHYFAAAVTLYGARVKGGYEYPGQAYDYKTDHVQGFNTCIGCHDQHSLKVRVEACSACHQNVKTQDDLKNIRMNGSLVDYDGDGDTSKGIYYELEGVRAKLLQGLQAYASEVSKTTIVYGAKTYPYFFIDKNGNGTADADETTFDNKYNAWTGRLAKAAYNYQMSIKDPGAFAHGGKYIIELLYDSLTDLNTKLAKPVDMTGMHRIDAGHFAGSEQAFRHWDNDGVVPGAAGGGCAKCHSGVGLPMFLTNGTVVSVPPSNGLVCSTCHDDLTQFTRYTVDQVKFPSGAVLTFGKGQDANLCINCHQGRESTVSVNALIKGLDPDKTSDPLRFLNVHDFAAGATLFGTDAKGAYEYDQKTYVGQNQHVDGFNACLQCHDTHALSVKVQACGGCHKNVKTEGDLQNIRMSTTDFDGDGDVTEGMAGEVKTLHDALYAAIQDYAKNVAGTPILYSPAAYPYFFADTNGNGQADKDEKAYSTWTPRLLQAAYNYQYVTKDPGAFAHNGKYSIQILYDGLESLGQKVKLSIDLKKATRP